ncbi:MAG: glycerol-3-phosphate 1-O-acyltransferase PlsY [candidate division WOR-3 bacterium]
MQEKFIAFFLLILTYPVSGIPFGLIYVKIFKKTDVRQVGSGNIGATNVLRAAGIKIAALTALSDILKSAIPVLIAKNLFSDSLYPYLIWLTSIVGHCFSPYLKFKGGKGVATFFGGLFVLSLSYTLWALILWLFIIVLTGYVSLGSITAVLIPFVLSLVKTDYSNAIIYFLGSSIIILRHKDNILRLLKGTENRFKILRK